MTRPELTTRILAIIIAIFLWAYVRVVLGIPEVSRIIENVPVSPTGHISGLKVQMQDRITVTIRGTRDQVNNILREEIVATVDVSGIKSAKKTTLPVNIEGLPSGVRLSGSAPSVVVTTLPMEQKVFPVTIAFTTQPPPGTTVGKYYVSPATVTVEGTRTALNTVKYVAVFVDPTERITSTISLGPRAVNANAVTVQEVSISDPLVRVGIETVTGGQVTRQLAVRAPELLNPPWGVAITVAKLQPDVVTLGGEPAMLDNIKGYVETEPINARSIRKNSTRTVRVRVPAGVRLLGDPTVRVDLEVQPTQ
ncbi:MAG: CdaR family protein [Armatimonadota bacterium]